MKTLTNYADLIQSYSRIYVPAYWLCCKNTGGIREAACTVNWVSLSCFVKPLVGFSKPDMTVNIFSSSSAAYQKDFHIDNQLTKTQKKLPLSGFSKDLHN